jgi:hypothetical protein
LFIINRSLGACRPLGMTMGMGLGMTFADSSPLRCPE